MTTPACHAPTRNLVIYPDGSVRVCCISTRVLGNLHRDDLLEMWRGNTRRQIVDAIGRNDFTAGCEGCGRELAIEGREGSYAASFDQLAAVPGEWPAIIYLNLSNACNLQCVQCDGTLSSSIRRHRERLPALTRFADEAFFESLARFLPHIRGIEIAGGEPFVAPETYRLLDLVDEVAPSLHCRVITNGTQWNSRIEELVVRHRMDVTVSLDALSVDLIGRIRPGADPERVLVNLDRFISLAERIGTRVGVNHCLMPENAHEFADLLIFAEERHLPVSVSVVRDPPEHSIVHQPVERIRAIRDAMSARDAELRSGLALNLEVWSRELARISTWADSPDEGLGGHEHNRIMWFDRDGSGPLDDATECARLARLSSDGRVFRIRVGPDQLIEEVDDALGELFPGAKGLHGRHVRTLLPVLSEVLGSAPNMDSVESLVEEPDLVVQQVDLPGGRIRVSSVPLRDASGRADAVSMLLALVGGPRTSVHGRG